MRPVNIASKKAYRGVILTLWATADEKGYTAGTWRPYKQWAETAAQVRKGAKAAYIVFYKEITLATATAPAMRPIPASSRVRRRYSLPNEALGFS
jgi:antirestriction protein ArdC